MIERKPPRLKVHLTLALESGAELYLIFRRYAPLKGKLAASAVALAVAETGLSKRQVRRLAARFRARPVAASLAPTPRGPKIGQHRIHADVNGQPHPTRRDRHGCAFRWCEQHMLAHRAVEPLHGVEGGAGRGRAHRSGNGRPRRSRGRPGAPFRRQDRSRNGRWATAALPSCCAPARSGWPRQAPAADAPRAVVDWTGLPRPQSRPETANR